jgi:hypothetical protein
MGIDATLAQHGDDFAHALQREGGQNVSCQLHEVGRAGILAYQEQTLTKSLQERRNDADGECWAGGYDEELSGTREIRISKDRCGHITLPCKLVLF